MAKKIFIAFAAIIALSILALAAANKPNFSGTWTMDRARSFGMPGDMTQVLTIVHKDDTLEVETKIIQPNNERTVKDTIILDGKEHDFEYLVCMKDGKPVAVDPNDEKNAVTGDLMVDTEVGGIKVKSALQVIHDAANSKAMDEWSKICGISAKDIEVVAKELTSHGKKAVVDVHRGIAQHTNGFYNVTSAMTISSSAASRWCIRTGSVLRAKLSMRFCSRIRTAPSRTGA